MRKAGPSRSNTGSSVPKTKTPTPHRDAPAGTEEFKSMLKLRDECVVVADQYYHDRSDQAILHSQQAEKSHRKAAHLKRRQVRDDRRSRTAPYRKTTRTIIVAGQDMTRAEFDLLSPMHVLVEDNSMAINPDTSQFFQAKWKAAISSGQRPGVVIPTLDCIQARQSR